MARWPSILTPLLGFASEEINGEGFGAALLTGVNDRMMIGGRLGLETSLGLGHDYLAQHAVGWMAARQ